MTSKSLSFKTLTLHDIQPLFGGQDVRLQANGEVRVHIVTPREKARSNKYRLTIEAEKLKEIDNLLTEVEFEEIETQDRPGEPDEARPKITVHYPSGEKVEKEKWANDEHPRFDKIYNWLIQLAKETEEKGTPDIATN